MTQQSARHHTVPQGILRNFCYSGEKLYYYSKDREKEGVASRDISKKFFRLHYYSVNTSAGIRSDKFERDFLQKIDDQFAVFIRELIEALDSGLVPQWDHETGNFARQFIYYYQKRSPDFYNTLEPEKTFDEILGQAALGENLFNLYGYDEFFKKIDADESCRNEVIKFARVQVMARTSPAVMARFSEMSLVLGMAAPGTQFIVGSHPVVRMGAGSNLELGDGIVELWTPISRRYCLGLVGTNRNQERRVIVVCQKKVRRLNCAIYRQSRQIGAASEKLLNSIVYSKYLDFN